MKVDFGQIGFVMLVAVISTSYCQRVVQMGVGPVQWYDQNFAAAYGTVRNPRPQPYTYFILNQQQPIRGSDMSVDLPLTTTPKIKAAQFYPVYYKQVQQPQAVYAGGQRLNGRPVEGYIDWRLFP